MITDSCTEQFKAVLVLHSKTEKTGQGTVVANIKETCVVTPVF